MGDSSRATVRYTLLVAEDDPNVRDLVASGLHMRGYTSPIYGELWYNLRQQAGTSAGDGVRSLQISVIKQYIEEDAHAVCRSYRR